MSMPHRFAWPNNQAGLNMTVLDPKKRQSAEAKWQAVEQNSASKGSASGNNGGPALTMSGAAISGGQTANHELQILCDVVLNRP